jgi:hypothetical protein
MDLLQYHRMRTAIQANASPGSAEQVSLVAGVLRDRLIASGLFAEVEVGPSEDPDHLVIALCAFSPDYSEDRVADAVEDLWHSHVRYPFWAAHGLLVQPEHVEFEGATRASATGRYVTVHLVAKKAHVPAQPGGGKSARSIT